MSPRFFILLGFASAVLLASTPARADSCSDFPDSYCKLSDPPDVEKHAGPASDLTCWLITAANMLAGADYGTGDGVQARAEAIYEQMKDEFGHLE